MSTPKKGNVKVFLSNKEACSLCLLNTCESQKVNIFNICTKFQLKESDKNKFFLVKIAQHSRDLAIWFRLLKVVRPGKV